MYTDEATVEDTYTTQQHNQYPVQPGTGLLSNLMLTERDEVIIPYMHPMDEKALETALGEYFGHFEANLDDKLKVGILGMLKTKKLQSPYQSNLNAVCELVKKEYEEEVIPHHLVADLYNLYYTRIERLDFEDIVPENMAKFKMIEKLNNTVMKIMTQQSEVKTMIILRALLAHMLIKIVFGKYGTDPEDEQDVQDLLQQLGQKQNPKQANSGQPCDAQQNPGQNQPQGNQPGQPGQSQPGDGNPQDADGGQGSGKSNNIKESVQQLADDAGSGQDEPDEQPQEDPADQGADPTANNGQQPGQDPLDDPAQSNDPADPNDPGQNNQPQSQQPGPTGPGDPADDLTDLDGNDPNDSSADPEMGNGGPNAGNGDSAMSDLNNQLDKIMQRMYDSKSSQELMNKALDGAKDQIGQMEEIMDEEDMTQLWDELMEEKEEMLAKLSPDLLEQMEDELRKISINSTSLKSQIKHLLDKTVNYFSSKAEIKFENILESDHIADLIDYELLHPKIRNIFLEDIMVRDQKRIGKINSYTDISGSMTESSGAHDDNGSSMTKSTLAKAITYRLKKMNLLNKVFTFENSVHATGNKLMDVLLIDGNGGTDIDNVVKHVEDSGENGLIITDAEDCCRTYSDKAFFVGIAGCRFDYFEKDILAKYVRHNQIIVFDGKQIRKVDEYGHIIQ